MINNLFLRVRFAVCVLLFLLSGLFYFSCEVGLGSSVDTESPTLSITYPAESSVICGSFVFAGTCDDDSGVKSVVINISNSDTTDTYGPYYATIDDKTWSATLNEKSDTTTNGWTLPDGTYSFSVVASDSASRSSGTSSHSYRIDNTAPVLVLTKPTSIGSNTAKTYGQTVQLEGSFSEACSSIEKLVVSFYDSTGAKLFDSEFDDIADMSNANPLKIAEYYSNTDDRTENETIWNNYETLFGSDSITNYENGSDVDTKEFYVTVTAYDSALEYKDSSSSAGTGDGNVSKTYYRGTTDMLNLIQGKNSSFSSFSVLALRNYLNGTTSYTDDEENALNKILSAAESVSTNTTDTKTIASCISNTSTEDGNVYLNFSINPQNNPTFAISGYAIDESSSSENYTDGYYSYYAEGTLNISVAPGLDDANIDTSTVTMYYGVDSNSDGDLDDDDETKLLLWTWNEDVAVKYAMSADSSLTEENAITAVEASPATYRYTSTTSDENTDSLSKSTSLSSSEIKSGKKYIFVAEGEDINDQSIINSSSDGYGFCAKSNANAPEISLGSANSYINLENNSVIKEDVFIDTDNYSFGFSGTITSEEELSSAVYSVTLSDQSSSQTSVSSEDNSIDITNFTEVNDSYTYTISFTTSATSNMKTMLSTDGLYTVTVKISATNSQTSSVTRTITLDNTVPTIANTSVSNSSSGTITVNETSTSVYYINNTNTFSVAGVSTDNYTMDSTLLIISGYDSDGAAKTSGTYSSSSNSWTFSGIDLSAFYANSSAVDAVVTISALDSAGNSSVSTVINLEFDSTVPELYITDGYDKFNSTAYDSSSKNYFNSSSLTVSGTWAEAGSGISAVYYQIYYSGCDKTEMNTTNYNTSGVADGTYSTTDNGTTETYSTIISGFSTSEKNYLYYIAVDNVGNVSSLITREIYIDTDAPSVSQGDSISIISNSTTSSGTITFTTYDSNSGIDSVTAYMTYGGTKYSTDDSYGAVDVTSTSTVDSVTTYTYSYSINDTLRAKLTSSGSVGLSVSVTDKAGNSTTMAAGTITIDTTGPTLKFSSPTASSTVNKKITISGTATDANGLCINGTLTIYAGTSENPTTSAATATVEDDTWSCTLDTTSYYTTESGTLYIKAAINDVVGNTGSLTESVTVNQNKDRPNVKITSLASSGSTLMYGTNAAISGTITDDDSSDNAIVATFVTSTSQITDAASATSVTSSEDIPVVYYNTTSGKYTTENISVAPSDTALFYKFSVEETYTNADSTTTTLTGYDITEFDPTTGDFTFTPHNISDGTKSIYFFVSDNKSASFYTGNSSELYQPYVQFKASTAVDNDTSVTYVSDSESPSITSVKVSYGDDSSANDTTGATIQTSLVLGGTVAQYAMFTVVASDASGIASIAVSATDGTNTFSGSVSDSTSFTSDTLDLSSWSTGSVTVTVTVTDNSGLYSNSTSTFTLDNEGPTLSVTSPSSSEEVTGNVSVVGIATDSGGSSTSTIQWLVPTSTERTSCTGTDDADTDGTDDGFIDASVAKLDWTGSLADDSTVSAWEFDFDGTSNSSLTTYDLDTYYLSYSSSSGIYTLPLYLKAEDALGNYTILYYSLKHNPDADKPKVEITYPTDSDYDTGCSYVTIGCTIRVTGTCEIPSGTTTVDTVYIQISDSDGDFDSTDKTTASGIYGYTTVDYADAATSGITSTDDQDDWWGIAATKTSSTWYINLNATNLMDPSSDSETNNIQIRACAVNANKKVGAWSDAYSIHIDKTAPQISVSLCQYEGATGDPSSSTVTATNSYTSGMYLKGSWYLVVAVIDESGITESSISVKEGTSSLTSGTGYYTSALTEDSNSGYTIYIPVSTSSSSITYTVSATDIDTSGHTVTNTYTLNIDNTAPTIKTLYGNGNELTTSSVISDSNYVYTLKSILNEEGSGFSKMAFCYMRTSDNVLTNGTPCILDPMLSDSTVALADLNSQTITQNSNEYTLYGLSIFGSQKSTTTFTPETLTNVTNNTHIRVGGLIYIGGVYRTITSIDSGVVTFDSDTIVSTYTTAFFPYVQVVDNTSSESVSSQSGTDFTFSDSSDDGDGMPESITESGTTYTCSGTVHSSNMPDGPVTVVCFAFDEAGNVAYTSVSTKISNNAPKLAKVYLGTDLDGDETYSEDEFVKYNILGVEGVEQSEITIETGSSDYSTSLTPFTIKNKMAVVPEFTGGNGDIGMIFQRDATTYSGAQSVGGTNVVGLISSTDVMESDATDLVDDALAATTNTYGAYVLTNINISGLETLDSDNNNDGTGREMSFTFWDSTDETTQGTTSNNCILTVSDFIEDLVDDEKPKGYISPFYWNSLTDNSIYGSSSAESFDDLNGHIELEDDWENSSKYDSSATSGEYDADPKVSGQIKIEGYAYDETLLGSISISIGGIDLGSGSGVAQSMSTYSSGAWSTNSSTISGKFAYTFEVENVSIGQTGHAAKWTLCVDTSKISGVADTDKAISVTVTDSTGNSSVASTTQTTTKTVYATEKEAAVYKFYSTATLANTYSSVYTTDTNYETSLPSSTLFTQGAADTTYTSVYAYTYSAEPYYKVDVVPYVTGLTTNMTKLKTSNPSVYGRTALGHYPVSSAETVTFAGFNLTDGTVTDSSSTTTTLLSLTSAASTFASGKITVTVNSVVSLNNVNSNSACGDYTTTTEVGTTGSNTVYKNYYNRQPNGDNNNLLTDDLYIDVWGINSTAAVPISGAISQPVMSINQADKNVGFAFVNGPLYFSMGGTVDSTTYSYQSWNGGIDFWTSVGFTYDSLGHSYGTAAGGDINSSGSVDRFRFFTDRWGRGRMSATGYYGNYNSNRLEAIGQLTSSGDSNIDKERIQSPSLATSVSGTSTNVYLAYYDAINDEIRFKCGNFTADKTSSSTGKFDGVYDSDDGNNSDVNLFVDEYGPGSYHNDTSAHYYELTYNTLIAGTSTAAPTASGTTANYSTGYNAGEYVSLAVTQNSSDEDVVVVVWYDSSNQQMYYSYYVDPLSNYAAGDYSYDSTSTHCNNWSTPITIFDSGIGEYCKVVADVNGGIHIAAYDSSNGDVDYAYLSSYSDTSAETCVVDSYGIIGTELTLDVALNSDGNPVPYIGYYASSSVRPKIAYKVTTSSNNPAGATDDVYTQNWEISLVPTSSKLIEDHINVGVWKSSGVLTNSYITGTTVGTTSCTATGSSYTASNYGTIYGNGTSNPFMGYAIKSGSSGYIETAQMK